MNNLVKTDLSKICSKVTDGTHDSPKILKKGVPFIKGKHLINGQIDFDNCDYISLDDHEKVIQRSKVEKGDILFSNIGSVGASAYVKTEKEFSIKNVALFKPNKELIDNRYLYYIIASPMFIKGLLNKKQGVAQPFLSLKLLRNHEFYYFEKIKYQKKIASVLLAYDKLIENNTRRIEVLEEMAQRIYKEWFINQELEERGILEIPYFTFLKQNIKKFDGFKRYYATADVEGTNFVKEGVYCDYKNKPSRAQKKPIINSVWFARMKDSYKIAAFTKANAFQAENSMLSSGFAGFSSKDIHFGFLYSTISSKVFDNLKNLYATGATQISLNNDGLSKIYVPYPNEEKVLEFCNIVNPIIDKSILLKNINKILIETRDYLLPKIISGKVDVSDLDIDTSILDD